MVHSSFSLSSQIKVDCRQVLAGRFGPRPHCYSCRALADSTAWKPKYNADLQTHHLALTSRVAQFIVSVGRDGRVTALGKDTSALAERDQKFAEELERQAEKDQQEEAGISDAIDDEAQKDQAAPSSGKLVLAEEIAKGRVDAKAWKLYLLNLSNQPILFLSIYTLIALLYRVAQSFSLWFLGQWGAHGEGTPTSWCVFSVWSCSASDLL